MQIIRDIEQGTPEWHDIRLGIITASRFKDVMAQGQGKTRSAYMRQLAAEIMTGEKQDGYTNPAMEWGTETEPQARAMYELENALECDQVTFILHDEIDAGCSPDGLVGDSGMVEFKCPNSATQIETFLDGDMPTTHKPQIQGQLWISEREWCDFVSFDPRINGKASYFCKRIYRDEKYINDLQVRVIEFKDELNQIIKKLNW